MTDRSERRKSASLLRTISKVSSTAARRISVSLRPSRPEHVYAPSYLPLEIVQQILLNLKQLHNCRTCYTRDLVSIVQINRTFYHALLSELYTTIKLHCPPQRLRLLFRTLEGSPTVASLVRRLTISTTKDGYDIIADIIHRCSRLESYNGQYEYFPQPMNGNAARRIGEALYAKVSLKEHNWWASMEQAGYQWFGFKLEDWVNYHSRWVELETLVLRGWRSVRALNKPVTAEEFASVFARLPLLKRVALSRFGEDEVDDDFLAVLPRQLLAVRLEQLPGLTMGGIARYTSTASALTSFSLIDLPHVITGADEIAALIASLPRLRRFIIRSSTPFQLAYVPPHLEELGSMEHQPVLTSVTLQYIHWHIHPPRPANDWLLHAILRGILPSLWSMQIPHDKDHLLQSIGHRVSLEEVQALRQQATEQRPHSVYREEDETEVDKALQNVLVNSTRDSPISYNITPLHPLLSSFLLLDNAFECLASGSFRPLLEHHSYTSTTHTVSDFQYVQWQQTDFGGIEGYLKGCMVDWGPRKCDGSWRFESEEMQRRPWTDPERWKASAEESKKRRRKGDWWHEPHVVDLWVPGRSLLDLF